MVTLIGAPFYICFSAFIIIFAARLFRSPSVLIISLAAALPLAAAELSLTPLTAYIIIATVALVFSGAGRFSSGIAVAALAAGYMYLAKCFE